MRSSNAPTVLTGGCGFHCLGQGQIRLALKTRDPDEAAKKAATEYQRAVFQAEHNLLPGKMSFDKVATRFLRSIEAPVEQKKAHATHASHKGVIERYLIPHFGKMPIAAITEPKLYAYIEWRRTFWDDRSRQEPAPHRVCAWRQKGTATR